MATGRSLVGEPLPRLQKTLAKNLSRAIVLAAHRLGKPGISFGRYGDSPEWVYKDDHTDVRLLGALAKLLPDLFSLVSLQEVIQAE